MSGVVPHLVRLAAPPVRPPVLVLHSTSRWSDLRWLGNVDPAPYRLVLSCSSTSPQLGTVRLRL